MSTLLLALLLLDAQPSPSPGASPSPSPSPAAVSAKRETLAEVAAKKAPARKKTPPAKVLTNDDLDKARQGGAAVSVLTVDGVEPSESVAATGEGIVSETMPSEEAIWRQRAQGFHAQVKGALAGIEQAELRLAQLRDNLRPGDPMDPSQQQNREAETKAETERLEEARMQLATARQALSDLEDEARAAGIPSGWLTQP